MHSQTKQIQLLSKAIELLKEENKELLVKMELSEAKWKLKMELSEAKWKVRLESLEDKFRALLYRNAELERMQKLDSSNSSKPPSSDGLKKKKRTQVCQEVSKLKGVQERSTQGVPYDLIIIGGGSAAFAAADTASKFGGKILFINSGLPLGGTCVNVGCVPSKFLIRVAERVHNASTSPFKGIYITAPKINFRTIVREKKKLVKAMQKKKYQNMVQSIKGITIIKGWATFQDAHTVLVNGKRYTAKKFIIATGARTNIPIIKGLKETGYLTSKTLFDLEKKPESLTILGAGYVGLEIAMAYARFGVKVRMLEFTDRVLRSQTPDISAEIGKHLKKEGIKFYPNYRIKKVERKGDSIIIYGKKGDGKSFQFSEPGHLVVATGIKPHTDKLGLNNIKLKIDKKGCIKVNKYMETSNPHIYAAGDCTNTPAYVYTATKEGKVAALNVYKKRGASVDYKTLPWVIFTSPQIAGAGIDEKEAKSLGIPHEVSIVPLSEIPRSIVASDTRGFIKLIRNPKTDELLGGRVVAPEGGELVLLISLSIKKGIKVSELADVFAPYLTLSEAIKIAAIGFEKDIHKLRCCSD